MYLNIKKLGYRTFKFKNFFKARTKVVGDDKRRRLTTKSSKWRQKFFIFLPLEDQGEKFEFSKSSPNRDFLYSGVFMHGEHDGDII